MQAEESIRCCITAYENEIVRFLLGDSWHPGGLPLTSRLAELANITSSDRVIDVGSGNGASAFHLARERGCRVLGVDATTQLALEAQSSIESVTASLVDFKNGDAEHLPAADEEFTVGLTECSLCLMPSETRALTEIRRVLSDDARLAVSDIVVQNQLPESLRTLAARVFCIGEGRSLKTELETIKKVGFSLERYELHPEALLDLIEGIRKKLFFSEILCGIGKLPLKSTDIQRAKHLLTETERCIEAETLNYAVIVASKS